MTLQDYADLLSKNTCVLQCVRDSEIFVDMTYVPKDDPCRYVWLSWSVTTGEQNFEQ